MTFISQLKKNCHHLGEHKRNIAEIPVKTDSLSESFWLVLPASDLRQKTKQKLTLLLNVWFQLSYRSTVSAKVSRVHIPTTTLKFTREYHAFAIGFAISVQAYFSYFLHYFFMLSFDICKHFFLKGNTVNDFW